MIRADTKKLIVLINDPENGAIKYEMARDRITDAHRAALKEIDDALVRLIALGSKEKRATRG